MPHGARSLVLFDSEVTAWEGSASRNWLGLVPGTRKHEAREIIQIGALRVLIHEGGQSEAVESLWLQQGPALRFFVKPTLNPSLSPYISRLTGITQRQVDEEGVDLLTGAKLLQEFVANSSAGPCACVPVLSWGDDFSMVEQNARLLGRALPPDVAAMRDLTSDVRDIFAGAGINISGYTSGTIHRHPAISAATAGHVHDAGWDTRSVLLALQALLRTRTQAVRALRHVLHGTHCGSTSSCTARHMQAA